MNENVSFVLTISLATVPSAETNLKIHIENNIAAFPLSGLIQQKTNNDIVFIFTGNRI